MYQAGDNEKLLGDFVRKHNVRDKIFSQHDAASWRDPLGEPDDKVVASKCGVDCFGDGSVTNSASHINKYIECTVERLGFTPDLYYLHRIDPSTKDDSYSQGQSSAKE